MTPSSQGPNPVSSSGKTTCNVAATEVTNIASNRTITVTSEIRHPQHMTVKVNRGTFKSALWACSPTENMNHVGNQLLGVPNPLEALSSLTVSPDPKVNNQRDAGQRGLPLFQEDRSIAIGHPHETELAIHPNGTLKIEYNLGQQAVLYDTTRMLSRYPEAPSPEEFKAMDPGEQGQIVKRFLGIRSAGVYARSMNSASQTHVSADYSDPVDNAGPEVSLSPANPVLPSAPLTRMRDVWRQRTTGQIGPVIGTATVVPAGQLANDLSPEGKFRGFFEGRSKSWDAHVSEHLPPAAEAHDFEESDTASALNRLEVSEDDFLQLVNDNYESMSAARDSDSGSDGGPLDSLQYVSTEGGAAGGSNEPGWPENPGDISLVRENSDLKNLVQQLEQVAGREEYTNIMNHIEAPEDPRDMPIYHTRHAAYHENLVRGPDDPPMFPAPEENRETPVVALSIAHLFQEMMQHIDSNEVLIKSFEQEFNAFVAAYSPNSHEIPIHQHFAVANKLIAHMAHLKKENEEMGKLIGCGMRDNMLAAMYDAEKCEMRQEIMQLREQVDRARKDKTAESMSDSTGELLKMGKENQRLLDEIYCLRESNAQLEQQELRDTDEVHAGLREEINNLRLRNDDLQEQLGDLWVNITEGGL